MSTEKNDARIRVKLGENLEEMVSEFRDSKVGREAQITRLSNRDRDAFLAALDSPNAQPNEALRKAARRYKTRLA